jgi:hypothetical protein
LIFIHSELCSNGSGLSGLTGQSRPDLKTLDSPIKSWNDIRYNPSCMDMRSSLKMPISTN